MELRYLYEFVDLSKTCNFQITAENMNTTQPCISKHIGKLEDELQVKLFDRRTRSVRLTEYGAAFAVYAQQLVEINDDALYKLNEMKRKEPRLLSIGFSPILGQYHFLETISSFQEKYPEFSTTLIESNEPEEGLKKLQYSVVFTSEDEITNTDWQRILYMHDHLVAVCSESHPLADRQSVTLRELQNEPFVIHTHRKSHCGLQNHTIDILQICQEKGGFLPKVATTASITATVARLVCQGYGIALMYRKHIPDDIEGIRIIDLSPEIPLNICAYFMDASRRKPVLDTFLNFIEFSVDHN